MRVFQYLFLPLSILYQGVLRLRNLLYNKGLLGITSFDIPTISVGNLAFGGTGKTPHIEYIIQLLRSNMKLAVLSRGYKRNTSGYQFGDAESNVFSLGDEPYQIIKKFPDVAVAVSENRVLGIPNLLFDAPETELVLLDDAYQHRAIKPGLNILLTEQRRLYVNDFLFPSGYLREYPAASNRADIIIVTKCDPNISLKTREEIRLKLKPMAHQKVFFSSIKYGQLQPYFDQNISIKPDAVLAFAGIANTSAFENYLKSQFSDVILKTFPDHHVFSRSGFQKILDLFEQMTQTNKILVSTEKDFQKLVQSGFSEILTKYPLFYLPIEVEFLAEDRENFHQTIIDYAYQNRTNN